jgi:hypothetical protein
VPRLFRLKTLTQPAARTMGEEKKTHDRQARAKAEPLLPRAGKVPLVRDISAEYAGPTNNHFGAETGILT